MITFGSSIVCMDHINFERDVRLADNLGVDFFHVDAMDGNFVPRYGIYPEIVRRISQISSCKMDLHLMVNDPEFAIDEFCDVDNISYVNVHYETNEDNIINIVEKLKGLRKKVGITLNLETPVSVLDSLMRVHLIDSVMFMGIRPGVLIQTARPDIVVKKSLQLRVLQEKYGSLDMVQCDGGVTFDSIPLLAEAGVNNFVCGSSTLYKDIDLTKSWEENSNLIKLNFNKMKSLVK